MGSTGGAGRSSFRFGLPEPANRQRRTTWGSSAVRYRTESADRIASGCRRRRWAVAAPADASRERAAGRAALAVRLARALEIPACGEAALACPQARATALNFQAKDYRVQALTRADLGDWPTQLKPFYRSKQQYKSMRQEHLAQLRSLRQLLNASNR